MRPRPVVHRPPRPHWSPTTTTFIYLLCLLLVSVCSREASIDWASIPSPPALLNNPATQQTVYFTVEKSVDNDGKASQIPDNLRELTLQCRADGNPRPEYSWRKNGKPFLPEQFPQKVVQKPGEGTLVFSALDEGDAGKYECLARNDNGTAVSTPIILDQTWIRHFKDSEPETVFVELGDPYARNCSFPQSNPPARVYWILMGDEPGQFESINATHVSSNDLETDFKPARYYTCTAENTELKDYKFGSKFRLEVTTNKRRSLTNVPPTEQYVNQSSPIALQGNQHKLHCFFSGYPAPKPDWYHNGLRLSEDLSEGFRFEAYGKTLVFNVTQDKAGKYECRFPMHNDIDRTFFVSVEAAPYWPEGPPPHTNTSEGESVTFDCTTSGKPEPRVTFYKNGVEMKKDSGAGKYVIEDTKLTIYDVKKGKDGRGDNAVYQCKAENKHGYVWTNFYLNLLAFKPQLLTEVGEVEAVAGQSVTLECKFFASPLAKVEWSSPVLQGVPHSVIPVNMHGVGKLLIKNVTPDAAGDYQCRGTNKYGAADGKASLVVRKATHLEPFASADEVHNAGSKLELPCKAEADPSLEVKYEWRVDGKPLPQIHLDNKHYEVDDDNTLHVNNPTQYDTARYTCIASTKLDKVEKHIAIQIKDVPVPVHSGYVSKCDGASQSAEVSFEHMEQADIIAPVKEFWVQYLMDEETDGEKWRTHPVPIAAERFETISDDNQRLFKGSATIGLQPYGHYQFRVIARNSVGDSSPTKIKDGCVTPSQIPDRNPSNVSASGSAPENLIVHWKPMEREEWNGANFHYKIRYRPKDESGSQRPFQEVDVTDPFADRHTIELEDEKDAQPWQPYEIQVQAINDQGPSNTVPQTVEGRTGEGVPAAVVKDFRVDSTTGTTAQFSWSPVDPTLVNGDFKGYKVTYWSEEPDEYEDESGEEDSRRFKRSPSRLSKRQSSAENGDASSKRTALFGPSATTGTVEDLRPNTMNYATIAVVNGLYEGEQSDVYTFRTAEGVPESVRDLHAYPMNSRNDDEGAVVVLRWQRPRVLNGNLTDYTIEWCKANEFASKFRKRQCASSKVPAGHRQLRLAALEHETEYRFVVKANTGAGEGDPSSDDAKTLPENVAAGLNPSVPTLKESGIGEDHFNITFIPSPFDEASRQPVGSNHLVRYRESGTETWHEAKPDNDDLTVKVADLAPGTKYDVSVVAVHTDDVGQQKETMSAIHQITTAGSTPRSARLYLLLLILLIILLLLIICCIICVALRHRGENYPVSQKERDQGREREPVLGSAKGSHFGEYAGPDDEKRSLTGSKTESETDSMAEYGDGNLGRFDEDGSFIRVYVPQNPIVQERPEKGSTSTFV